MGSSAGTSLVAGVVVGAAMKNSGGGQTSPENKSVTVRYAPYIEEKHDALLGVVVNTRKDIITNSPYSSYIDQDANTSILGVGYTIADFPALYDMFGKYMSGFNIEVLWERIFNTQTQREEIDGIIQAQLSLINDNTIQTIPEFTLNMRDLNSINSSSFVVGKANLEQDRIKKLATISATAKFKVLSNITNESTCILNWKKNTTITYAELMKYYYLTVNESDEVNTDFNVIDKLWPFTVLDFERAALAAMQSKAITAKGGAGKRKRSDLSKVLLVASYTVQGMQIGTMIGGPGWGTFIGGVIGFCIGVGIIMTE